tara:strand:- start:72 stop:830 length:759 start_codon:yes stop_codon:yes gene_type:complete
MNTSTLNNKKDPFIQLSNEWWDENGKFQALHIFTDIRIQYINRVVSKYKESNKTYPLNKLKCLDIGCGGGLLSERIARLGASVTGIDITKSSIKVAKIHALNSGLNINYINTDVSSFIKKYSPKKFDLIIASEVIEHLDNRNLFFKEVSELLKNKGILILTTINKTALSLLLAKFMAENILKILPKGIHDFEKFVSPETLINEAKLHKIHLHEIVGFKPIFGLSSQLKPVIKKFKFTNFFNINYGISGIKII